MAAFADGRAYDGKGSAAGKARRIRFSRRRDYEMMPPDISATDSIAEALRKTGGLRRRLPVDCFVVITDNETWAGDIHPVEVLRQYREGIGMGIRQTGGGRYDIHRRLQHRRPGGWGDAGCGGV